MFLTYYEPNAPCCCRPRRTSDGFDYHRQGRVSLVSDTLKVGCDVTPWIYKYMFERAFFHIAVIELVESVAV